MSSKIVLNFFHFQSFFLQIALMESQNIAEHLYDIKCARLPKNDVKISEILESISETRVLFADIITA